MKESIFEESLDGLTIERVVRDYEFTMPTKHFHNEFEIYYLLKGERYYFIEKETYYVKKGSLVLVNKGLIHKTSFVGDSHHERILIELKEEKFDSFFSLGGRGTLLQFFEHYTGVYEFSIKEQSYVEELLCAIAEEIQQKREGYEWMVYMKLTELFILIMRNKNLYLAKEKRQYLSAKHKKVQEIADYLLKNYSKDISLDHLAEQFFVSKFYLSRIFKEVTGFAVTEYINIQRVKKAQEILVEEDLNITEVAEILGYESITYFEKVFKRYCGNSPLKFRKEVIQKKKNLMRVI